jgi:CheY-like chemotaxis protein
MNSNDQLVFADESDEVELEELPPWKLLIVDDEPDVHSVTRMVMNGFRFDGRGLTFLSAYDGVTGLQLLEDNPDIAIVLLDVVMETDDAGLRAARAIREQLDNQLVRIVLRTGQPGQAPEERVVLEYDINDYKAKTELTAARLFTTVASALRAYRDMQRLQNSRRGLQKIVEAAASLFSLQSLRGFMHGVLEQMTSLMPLSEASLVLGESSLAADPHDGKVVVLAGTGVYREVHGEVNDEQIEARVLALIHRAMASQENQFEGDACALFIEGPQSGRRFVVYLEGYANADDRERSLVDLFCQNLAVAYDNARRFEESQASKRSIALRLQATQDGLRESLQGWQNGEIDAEAVKQRLQALVTTSSNA